MLHVLGDVINSVGVIIAATLIYFVPAAWMADPICTYIFSVLVIITTVPVFKQCVGVIMLGTPKKFNLEEMKTKIQQSCTEVEGVHDLHVWHITL